MRASGVVQAALRFTNKAQSSVLVRDAYVSTVTVTPVTSTIRSVPSEVDENGGVKGPWAINLHNAVTVSQAWVVEPGGAVER